jgi:hypothetical protein
LSLYGICAVYAAKLVQSLANPGKLILRFEVKLVDKQEELVFADRVCVQRSPSTEASCQGVYEQSFNAFEEMRGRECRSFLENFFKFRRQAFQVEVAEVEPYDPTELDP